MLNENSKSLGANNYSKSQINPNNLPFQVRTKNNQGIEFVKDLDKNKKLSGKESLNLSELSNADLNQDGKITKAELSKAGIDVFQRSSSKKGGEIIKASESDINHIDYANPKALTYFGSAYYEQRYDVDTKSGVLTGSERYSFAPESAKKALKKNYLEQADKYFNENPVNFPGTVITSNEPDPKTTQTQVLAVAKQQLKSPLFSTTEGYNWETGEYATKPKPPQEVVKYFTNKNINTSKGGEIKYTDLKKTLHFDPAFIKDNPSTTTLEPNYDTVKKHPTLSVDMQIMKLSLEKGGFKTEFTNTGLKYSKKN